MLNFTSIINLTVFVSLLAEQTHCINLPSGLQIRNPVYFVTWLYFNTFRHLLPFKYKYVHSNLLVVSAEIWDGCIS